MNFVEFLKLKDYYTSKIFQYPEGPPPHSYAPGYYVDAFSDRYAPINILEIGIYNGESMRIWDDWFVNGNIYGLDNDCSSLGRAAERNLSNRVHLFCGDAYSEETVNTFTDNFFDFVIDDGSHVPQHQKDFVNLWLPKVKSGGKLIIEDISIIDLAEEIKVIADANPTCKESKIFDLRKMANYWPDDILVEIIKL
jgi:SAM-dependent methyltransferase